MSHDSRSSVEGQGSSVAKHIPVLLKEVLEVLNPKPGEFIIDGTTNGGGHLAAIIERMKGIGKILAVDWDEEILSRTKERIELDLKAKSYKLKAVWANANYADLPEILKREKLGKVDGLLLDLGFSSEQLDSLRGFSFKKGDEPLDMRYDKSSGKPTAAEIINSAREDELARILFEYGEERFSRQIASAIVKARKTKRIVATSRLVEIVKSAIPKFFKKGEMDVLARVFQALRIEVNDELGNLREILANLPKVLKSNGRIAIITFHSLEDRMVKERFKEMAENGKLKILNKKPIKPEEVELAANPKSRSAKLRAAQII